MLFSCLLALLCVVLAALLRSRLLFVIAVVCWVQNILLPWWYTKGWVSESSAHSLLLVKEALLLFLVVYGAWMARRVTRFPLPWPIRWALLYGTYISVRLVLGMVVLREPLFDELRLVRSMLFPVETIVAGFLVGVLAPRIAPGYERFVIWGLTACAVVSLLLYFTASHTFWVNDVNIALYNVNVKGDPEWTVLPELGVSGSGVGREVFGALSAFRLIGTFGDPLTAGMVLAAGLLLVAARDRLTAEWLAVGCVLAGALFFTFSRSAWVFATVGFMYLSLVQRRLARLGVFVAAAATLWFALAGLREFLSSSVAAFDLQAGDVYHAQGILTFYSSAILNPSYLLGAGPIDPSAQSWVLENGLAYMLVQFGVPAVVCFVGVCLSAERYLRHAARSSGTLAVAGAACAVSTLIAANLSFYALSFTAYYGIWSIVGLATGAAFRVRMQGVEARARERPITATASL